MDLHATNCCILVAQISDSTICQLSTFANKHALRWNWRSGFKVSLNCTAGYERNWNRSLIVPLFYSERCTV